MKKIFLILILIFISRLSLALNVMPAKMIISQRAGEEKQYHFTIKNTKKESVIIKISVCDFDITINGEIVITERETLPEWVGMHTKEVRISPDALKKIFFTIRLSTGAIGERRAMFYFQETAERKGAVGFVMNLGSAVYCVSEGTKKIKGKINNFKISTDEVSLLFSNLGNIHLRPEIKLKIIQDSKLIDEIILNKDFPVLPLQDYIITKKLNTELEIGNYTAILEIKYGEIFEIQEIPFGIFKVK